MTVRPADGTRGQVQFGANEMDEERGRHTEIEQAVREQPGAVATSRRVVETEVHHDFHDQRRSLSVPVADVRRMIARVTGSSQETSCIVPAATA